MENKRRLALCGATAAALLTIPLAASADTLTVEAVESAPGKTPQPHSFSLEIARDRATELHFGTDEKSFELEVFWDNRKGKRAANQNAPLVYSLKVRNAGKKRKSPSHVTLRSAVPVKVGTRQVIGRFTAPGGRVLELALTLRR